MGLFDSLVDLAASAVTIAVKPVEIVADVAGAVVKPLADGATALAEEVKDLTK